MSDNTGAELLTSILADYGVQKVLGNPGTTELPFIDAVERHDGIEYVMTLHEDVAVGAAAGYSNRKRYYTDDDERASMLSVVSLHTTPGMAHGLGNLYGAWFAGAPIIVTTGSQRPDVEARRPPLSGDRVSMVAPYTKDATVVEKPADIPRAVRNAAETALTPPTGPVFLDLPLGMQQELTDAAAQPLDLSYNTDPAPNAAIQEAVEALHAAEDPLFIIGDRLAQAGPTAVSRLLSLAEATDASMYGELLLAETGVPTHHDQWDGILGLNQEDVEPVVDTDTILYVGVQTENPMFAESLENVPPADATTIHVAYNDSEVGDHYSGVELIGNIEATLDSLQRGFEGEPDSGALGRARAAKPVRDKRHASVGLPTATELAEVIGDELGETILVDEAVTSGFILRETVDFDYGQLFGQKSGGLGYGLPASVGVAIAEEERDEPARNVMCYIGDGSYQYYPQTLYTADRYVEDALSIVLVDNSGYRILRDADVLSDKAATTDRSLTFQPSMDFKKNAESYSVETTQYKANDSLHRALRRTLDADSVSMLTVPIEEE